MKIIVLGGEGMLGHKVFQVLSSNFPETKCSILGSLEDCFYRSISLFDSKRTLQCVNAMELPSLCSLLKKEKPDYLINCIGIVKQRDESKHPIPSIILNSLLPHLLAEWGVDWGCRLIHFSTDCVFSGKKGNYNETDLSDAEDIYGKTKYLGEVDANKNALTLRTSIIGRELNHFKSLLEWFLSQKGKKVKGYRKVIYSGLTTNYLAKVISRLIDNNYAINGLYQITGPSITKYDLLVRLRDAYKLDIEIEPDNNEVSARSMNGGRFYLETGIKKPHWDEMIEELVRDKTPYDKWIKRK